MKYLMLLLWLFTAVSVQAQVFPTALGGIVLGQDISTIREICRMHTEIPLSLERHLMEVQLVPGHAPGIRGGSVAFANCLEVGRIVRIKLKFEDGSRPFFDNLLQRYQQRFGKPQEWRGDPFQTVRSWKWSFRDGHGEQVNLELTHNAEDGSTTENSVKMTLRSLWLREDDCQDRKTAQEAVPETVRNPLGENDFRLLVPQ